MMEHPMEKIIRKRQLKNDLDELCKQINDQDIIGDNILVFPSIAKRIEKFLNQFLSLNYDDEDIRIMKFEDIGKTTITTLYGQTKVKQFSENSHEEVENLISDNRWWDISDIINNMCLNNLTNIINFIENDGVSPVNIYNLIVLRPTFRIIYNNNQEKIFVLTCSISADGKY